MTHTSRFQWDANTPAFSTLDSFLQCQRFFDRQGSEVSGKLINWGDLHLESDQEVEMFDLLFSHDALCHPLSAGVYTALTLVEGSDREGFAGDTYFSMICRANTSPDRWKMFSLYGADGNNMAIASATAGKKFRSFREKFESSDTKDDKKRWNLLSELTLSFNLDAARLVAETGVKVASPGSAGTLVVIRTSKIANLFIGYCGEDPVAIQGAWL